MTKLIKIVIIFLIFQIISNELQAQPWIQIGDDIGGENYGNKHSVSINEDGTVLAIGAPYEGPGYVQVYHKIDNTWINFGQDIVGTTEGSRFGYSVSLSADGKTVVIGAPWENVNGYMEGCVRVFNNNNHENKWSQVGSDIYVPSSNWHYHGASVSINSSGNIIAYGSFQGDGAIFQNINNEWIQLGEDIGEHLTDNAFNAVKICLNSEGNIVTVGDSEYLNNGGSEEGKVKVYKYIEQEWLQIGNSLHGIYWYDLFGTSVSLSSDGYTMAVSVPGGRNSNLEDVGVVIVYKFISGDWVQVGNIIFGDSEERNFGYSVSLNDDGSVLVIGSHPYYCGIENSSSGNVKVFYYSNDAWLQVGSDICGESHSEFGKEVSISKDGNYIGIVSHVGGFAGVYQTPSVTCIGDVIKNANEDQVYIVQGIEFDPFTINENCDIIALTNNINNSNTLAGEKIPVGTNSIIWEITDCENNIFYRSFLVTVNEYSGINIETTNLNYNILYPNPTSGIVNLNFQINDIQELVISDITGKRIFENFNIQQVKTIDLSSYKSGVYIISIRTEKEIFTSKIVKY